MKSLFGYKSSLSLSQLLKDPPEDDVGFYKALSKANFNKASPTEVAEVISYLNADFAKLENKESEQNIVLYRSLLSAHVNIVNHALSKGFSSFEGGPQEFFNYLQRSWLPHLFEALDTANRGRLGDDDLHKDLLKTLHKAITFADQFAKRSTWSLLTVRNFMQIVSVVESDPYEEHGEVKEAIVASLNKHLKDIPREKFWAIHNSCPMREMLFVISLTEAAIHGIQHGSAESGATENKLETLSLALRAFNASAISHPQATEDFLKKLTDLSLLLRKLPDVERQKLDAVSKNIETVTEEVETQRQQFAICMDPPYSSRVVKVGDVVLSESASSAYESVKEGRWINDDAINAVFPEIFKNHRDGLSRLEGEGVSVDWLPPAVTRLFLQNDPTSYQDTLARINSKSIVLMPISNSRDTASMQLAEGSGTHLMLMMLDRRGEVPVYYLLNSAGRKYENQVPQDIAKTIDAGLGIVREDKSILGRLPFLRREKVPLTLLPSPQQGKNMADCGHHTFKNADVLLYHLESRQEVGPIKESDYKNSKLSRIVYSVMIVDADQLSKHDWMHPPVHKGSLFQAVIVNAMGENLEHRQVSIRQPSTGGPVKPFYANRYFIYTRPMESHTGPDGERFVYAIPRVDKERPKKISAGAEEADLCDLADWNKLGKIEDGEVFLLKKVEGSSGAVTVHFNRSPQVGEKLCGPFKHGIENGERYIVCNAVPGDMPSAEASSRDKKGQLEKKFCKVKAADLEGTGRTLEGLIKRIDSLKEKSWEQWDEKDRLAMMIKIPAKQRSHSSSHTGQEETTNRPRSPSRTP